MAIWTVEQSHLIDHPITVDAVDAKRAIQWIRHQAVHPRKFVWQLPFGPIDVEISENGSLIRAFFRDKNGKRKRFMRLRRV